MADQTHLERLERLERLSRKLDAAFRIPGTRFRVGFDTIIGLVPGIGDAATMLPAAWIIYESHRMGLPRHKLVQQGVNAAIDGALGSVPLIGDLFDAGFKANLRNVQILRTHLEGGTMRDVTPPPEDAFTDNTPPR